MMNDTASDALFAIFPGESEMARKMRETDWTATPLGDPSGWTDALKIPLRMLLTSRFEMWLGWGPDLCFFYNDAYMPTLGVKHPAALGRPFQEVWSEVYADVKDQVDRVATGGSTWNDALLLLLERSGFPEETYHSFSYSPLHDAEGRIAGLLCVVSEETERVITERRMAMLRLLGTRFVGSLDLNAISASICATLAANRRDFPFALMRLGDAGTAEFSSCSDDAAHLTDFPWAEIDTGKTTVRLPANLQLPSGPWDKPPTDALIIQIPGSAGSPAAGALVLALNPYRRDEDLSGFAELIAAQISGAIANVRALETERRRAERIWVHARDLMIVVDADGVIRSASPAWTRILGHPVENVVGQNLDRFVLADDMANTHVALDQAVSGADVTGFENRYVTASGEARWISWHTAQEEGLVYAYGRDVTEQRQAAEALASAESALRQSQKMEAVGQLTGGIAHDFNNLLTGIIGSLEMMQRKSAQGRTADVNRYAAAATTSANRAAALTQRLLAFSRRQSLDPKRVDANQLVRGMEELLRRSIGEAIELECVASGGLWPTRCDPNQLENAILNLSINARDAMPRGGRLTIETGNASIDDGYARRNSFATPGQYVTISVTDTGTGMTPETVSKAFDPFFTTKPIGQGTGLGLSMIYGFARQSGGFVNIYSEIGLGSTIRIYLPRDHGAGVSEEISEEPAELVRSDDGDTVLVVEDEEAVRALIVDVLQELGYRTMEAVDGPSGLEILQSDAKIDLLVTDVGLPGLNGRQLADAARVSRPDLKILFVTGYAHNAAVGNGLLEPGMEIITKPFTIDKLASRVRMIVEG